MSNELDTAELDEPDTKPVDIEAEQDEADAAAAEPGEVDTKAELDEYRKVFRIEHRGAEKGSKAPDLGEGFDDEPYARATVHEAVAHGWRVEDGVLAERESVERFDPFSIDITYAVTVVPAAGAPAGPPVGETAHDVAVSDPHVDENAE